MIIKLNGIDVEINKTTTLMGIVEEKGLLPEHIVVEHNREIVPKDRLEDIIVSNDDSIEIVSFVGGG